jgi:hypothetical protein
MIFARDPRPKIIPSAPFSLSNPDHPAFNHALPGFNARQGFTLGERRNNAAQAHNRKIPNTISRRPLIDIFRSIRTSEPIAAAGKELTPPEGEPG